MLTKVNLVLKIMKKKILVHKNALHDTHKFNLQTSHLSLCKALLRTEQTT